jgi:hypothetical protein
MTDYLLDCNLNENDWDYLNEGNQRLTLYYKGQETKF